MRFVEWSWSSIEWSKIKASSQVKRRITVEITGKCFSNFVSSIDEIGLF